MHAPSAQVNPNIGATVILLLDHSPRVEYKFVNKTITYYFHEFKTDQNNGNIYFLDVETLCGEALNVFSMHLRILGYCLVDAHGLSFKSLHVHS